MIAGYCWPQSGIAGQKIGLAISADQPTCDVQVARIGLEEHVVARFAHVPVTNHELPADVAERGCGWPTSIEIEIDPAWDSGFYLVRLVVPGDQTADAFFVVRSTAPRRALLVLSTSTWAAYNDWGGPSFYTGGHISSQQRPLPTGFLDKPDPHRYRVATMADLPQAEVAAYFGDHSYWSCAAGWANWERLFVSWAERNGFAFDYATSLDLATDPSILEPYELYLSVGHDEYWSASMRDAVEGWVESGGFAAFFSGNTAFWQVRFEGPDNAMVGYKMAFEHDPVMGTPDQPSVSTMWSDPLTGRPENELTGVSFTRGGYAHTRAAPRGSGGYNVWRPRSWAFDGISLLPGDIVGAEPVVVGYECDGCELTLRDGLPVATGADGTPPTFEVLATAPARLWLTEDLPAALSDDYVGELNWVAHRLAGADSEANRARFANGRAVMGTFTRGGGTVFTVGCTDWAYGLDDPDIDRITRNVVARALALDLEEDG